MSKVYLLLRSNRQTGPFDLEELIQQNLKPFDLVWVEGRSFGWKYPSEIDALKPYLPFTIENDTPSFEKIKTEPARELVNQTNKAVFISMPQGVMNKTSKPIETKIMNSSQAHSLTVHPEHLNLHFKEEPVLETKYNKPLCEIEENYSSWVFDQKTQKRFAIKLRPLAHAIIILVIVSAGAWLAASMLNDKEQEDINLSLKENRIITPAVINEHSTESTIGESFGQEETSLAPTIPVVKKSNNPKAINNTANTIKSDNQSTAPVVEIIHNDPAPMLESEETVSNENIPSKPKKKKFGEAIEAFFDKLEGKDEQKESEANIPDRSQPPNNTGERRASRRSESSSDATVSIADRIQINSNAPAENWMTGIQGIKITIKNNSNKVLKYALVEVSYFDEYNNSIDRKKMEFKNIPVGSNQTLPVPEHRTADHINYKLISAEAKEDKFFKAF